MFCPYTSLQNGKVECTLHIINNMIYPLLFQASMLARYWVEGLHTATYLLNHLPCKVISVSSPLQSDQRLQPVCRSLRCAPSYEHLRVFGCACYPNLSAQAAHKLSPNPLIVSSSNTPLITKVISVSISPPTALSSPDMFLMRQSSPSLPRPI
jgi:hypothetical protein